MMEMGEGFLRRPGRDMQPRNADKAKVREFEAHSLELINVWRDTPGKVIHLKPQKPLVDTYGYIVIFLMGVNIGFCAALLMVGR